MTARAVVETSIVTQPNFSGGMLVECSVTGLTAEVLLCESPLRTHIHTVVG